MTPPPPSSATRPDAALVAALRRGDESAYESIIRSYGGRLLATARRILRNEEDARDAVQEGFLCAFRAIGRFQADSSLGTWLHRIVINAALMQLRRRRGYVELAIDELLPRFLPDGHHAQPAEPWQDSAESLLERRELRDFVSESIDRLPDAYRTVLLLRDIEELDTQEAAQLLGVSTNLVKVRLHRARQALRSLLAVRFDQPSAAWASARSAVSAHA
jgi:RNA polymerase sigma-70 factor (ECF subfamily)